MPVLSLAVESFTNAGMARRGGPFTSDLEVCILPCTSARQQCIILLIRTSSHVKLFDSFTFCFSGGLAGILWAPSPSHAHPSPDDEYEHSCGEPQADYG